MSDLSNDQTRSGGIDNAGEINTEGGDVVGRDKTVAGLYLGRDKSPERIVEILHVEIRGKNEEIAKLRIENKSLGEQVSATKGAFEMVKLVFSRHNLSVESLSPADYMLHTSLFLTEREMCKEFWTIIRTPGRAPGEEK